MKSFSDILDDLISGVTTKTPFTNFNPSAALRHILEVFASVIYDLYTLLRDVVSQSFVTTATGSWLDLKVNEVGIIRNPAVKARIYLTFSRSTPASSNIAIPSGTIDKSVKDAKGNDYRFLTTTAATLETGTTSVVVLAEAELVGTAYNVGSGTVTRLVTKIAGIETVTNVDFLENDALVNYLEREGCDEESDEALRERAILKWNTLGIGGTRDAYRQWAMSVSGVTAVSILDDFPYGPGTVGVVILGPAGAPSVQLIQEVQNYIDARKPLTADVRVSGPEIEIQNLSITVTRYANADQTTVDAAVQAAIDKLSGELQIGEGLVLARLIQTVMAVDGVYNVEITDPSEDVQTAPDHFIEIGTVQLTHRIKGRTYQEGGGDGEGGEFAVAGADIPRVNKESFNIS